MRTLNTFIGAAILNLYPNVSRVSENFIAYDTEGNIVTYDKNIVEEKAGKLFCKIQAKSLLELSDWSSLPDVNLTNKDEFLSYRATLRNLVLNPVADPVFPSEPTPIWSN